MLPTGHPMAGKSENKRADMHGEEGAKKCVRERESLDRTLEVARAARNLNAINNARRGGGRGREAIIHL